MRLEHSQGKQVPIERLFFEFLREATTTAMRLPQEVYDLIIDHLHNDRLSLRYCALVSRRWVYRSHAHFFYFLILGNKLFRRWLDAFSPSDNHIHSAVKVLILHPSLDSFEDFMRFAEYAPAFRNLEHLLINGRGLPYESQRSTCIRPFGHLGNNLKTLQLEYLDVNPRIIARFPRLEFLIMESPRLPSVGAEEGDDIPAESDIRGAFKGSIEFDIHPWEPGSGPFVAALTDCPLGYDTIKVDLGTVNGEGTARVLSHLVSRCSNTLEVLHVNSGSEQLCKSGPAQSWSRLPHTLNDRCGTKSLSFNASSRDLAHSRHRSQFQRLLTPIFYHHFRDDVQDHDHCTARLSRGGTLQPIWKGIRLV